MRTKNNRPYFFRISTPPPPRDDRQIRRTAGEDSAFNKAGNLREFIFHLDGIKNSQIGNIQKPIAVVGDETFAPRRIAQSGETPCDKTARHRNHFHRQRKSAELPHPLAFVGDADELLRRRRQNFFARQRAAAAFNHLKIAVNFVRAVDIQGDFADLIKIHAVNSGGIQPLPSRLRTRHGDFNFFPQRRQKINEVIHRRARPHAENDPRRNKFSSPLAPPIF